MAYTIVHISVGVGRFKRAVPSPWSRNVDFVRQRKGFKGDLMTKPVCAIIGIGPKNGASFARRFSNEGYALALL